MIKIKTKDIFSNCILLVFCFVIIAEFYGIISIRTSQILIMAFGAVSMTYYCGIRKDLRIYTTYYTTFLVFYFWGGLLSWIYNGNADFIELLWPVAFMGVSTVLLFGNVSTKMTSLIFFVYCAITVFLIFQRGGADYLGGTSSRNSVSVFVVLFLIMHLIAAFQNKKSVPIYYGLIAFVTCFAAIGRSGIIISVVIICIFCLIRFENGQSYIRNIKIFAWTILIIVVFYQVIMRLEPELIDNAIGNLMWRGLESKRTIMWSDYLSKSFSSFGNVIFGAKISGTQLLDFYNSNLHNSFLMLHAKYGAFVFLIVVVLMIKSLFYYYKEKNYFYFSSLVLCIIRMNFDYTNFNGILDTILVVLLLYPLYSKQQIKRGIEEK